MIRFRNWLNNVLLNWFWRLQDDPLKGMTIKEAIDEQTGIHEYMTGVDRAEGEGFSRPVRMSIFTGMVTVKPRKVTVIEPLVRRRPDGKAIDYVITDEFSDLSDEQRGERE